MGRRSPGTSDFLVDTSFLLPLVGIRVKGAGLSLEGKRLHYPSLMLAELFAAVMKEARKLNLPELPREALDGFLYVWYEVDLVQPAEQDLALAYRLISAGLNDFFDAVLYATHVRTSLPLVTMDRGLVEFLSSKNFSTEGITVV